MYIDSEDTASDKCNRPFFLTLFLRAQTEHRTHWGLEHSYVLFGCSGPHTLTPHALLSVPRRGCTLDISFSGPLCEFLLAVFLLHELCPRRSATLLSSSHASWAKGVQPVFLLGGLAVKPEPHTEDQVVAGYSPASPLLAMQPKNPWHSLG